MRVAFTSWLARAGGLLTAVAVLFAIPAAAQPAAWAWGLQSTNPTPTDGTNAHGNAVATDAAGRVYVGGEFGEDAGNPPLATRAFGSAATLGPGAGGFVAQATGAGQWAWATALTATAPNSFGRTEVRVTGLAATPGGDVYATGLVRGAGLAAGGQTASLSGGDDGLFVARLTSAGAVTWLRVVAGRFLEPSLAADPSTGGVVLADLYEGTPTFGAFALPTNSRSNGNFPFVARLSAAGTWTAAVAATGTGGVDHLARVAVGPAGQVALGGMQLPGSLVLGGLTRTVLPGSFGSFFVAQLGPANQWEWLAGSTSSSESSTRQTAYTTAGELWVSGAGDAGTTVGSLVLATGFGTGNTGTVGFVAKLSATGQWQIAQAAVPITSGFTGFSSLAVDAAGNALALGYLVGSPGQGQAQLGAQTLTLPANGILFFLASLNAVGQWRYVAALPSAAIPTGFFPLAIALDAPGNLYFTGSLRGGLMLGSSILAGSNDNGTPSPQGSDVVLGKLPNAAPLASRPTAPAAALALFPNPARGRVMLALPAAAAARPVRVLDALGRVVGGGTVPAQATAAHLDLRGLPAGVYGVRVGAAVARLVVE